MCLLGAGIDQPQALAHPETGETLGLAMVTGVRDPAEGLDLVASDQGVYTVVIGASEPDFSITYQPPS